MSDPITSILRQNPAYGQLSDWLRQAAQEHAGLARLSGPSGVGKSRLIQAVVEDCQPSVQMVELRAHRKHQQPLSVFRQWLAQRFLTPSSLKQRNPANAFASSYLRQVGSLPIRYQEGLTDRTIWLSWLAGACTPADAGDLQPRQLQELASLSLRQLLKAEAELRPQVLVILGSQWLDEDSARLAAELCADGFPIICTSLHDGPSGSLALDRLWSMAGLNLKMLPLSRTQVGELSAALATDSPLVLSEAVIDLLYERSQGRLYEVQQLTRYLLANSQIPGADGGPGMTESPARLLDLHWQTLTESMRHALAAASVCGCRFNADILGALLHGYYQQPRDSLPGLLQTGSTEGYWQRLDEAQYQFSDTSLHEGVYRRLDPAERRNLHHTCAQIIEDEFRPAAGYYAAEIAGHYAQADSPEAAHWFGLAAGQAREEHRDELAIEYYDRALAITGPNQDQASLKWLLHKAECAEGCSRIELAAETYDQLLHASRASGNRHSESLALSGLGHIADIQSRRAEAIELLEAALNLAQSIDNQEAAMLSWGRLGMVHDAKEEWQAAREAYQQKLVLAQAIQNEAGIISALNNIGLVLLGEYKFAEAINTLRQLSLRLQASNNLFLLSKVYGNLAYAYDEKGDIDAAVECYKRQHELAGRFHYRLGISIALCGLGSTALKLGQHQAAVSYLYQAAELGAQIGIKYYSSEYYYYLARALLASHEGGEAYGYLERALSDARQDDRQDIEARAEPLLLSLTASQQASPDWLQLRSLAEGELGCSIEKQAFACLELWRLAEPDRHLWQERARHLFLALWSGTGRDEYQRILEELEASAPDTDRQ